MKILFLLPRVPYPIEKGDKLRAYNFIKELSKNNEIHLFAIDDSNTQQKDIKHLETYCKSITIAKIPKICVFFNLVHSLLFKNIPLQAAYYYSKKSQAKFLDCVDKIQPEHIFCQLVRVAEYVKHLNIPKTIDIQDTLSLNIYRSAKKSNYIKKLVFNIEVKRLILYEQKIFDAFDNKILISKPDKHHYPHDNRDQIHIIPNGVDCDFFKPIDRPKDIDVIFTGNMGYIPNIDASTFIVKDILPLLLKEKPDIKIMIAGANPPDKIKGYSSENVIVTGWVDDIRNCYARAKVFIAPMRIGSGLQNKLLEAMAMKVPCITTPLVNEALGAKNKVNILIANNKEGLVDNIFSLLKDSTLSETLVNNAYNFVRKNYNWQTAGIELDRIIKSTNKN